MSQALTPATSADAEHADPAIRTITPADLRDVLVKGVEDFLATPTQLIFLCIIYPIVGVVFAGIAAGYDLMPLVYPMITGFALVGPIAALGLYELSRRREQGLESSWLNAFDVLRSPAILSIVVFAGLLLAIFVAWVAFAKAIHAMTIATGLRQSLGEVIDLAMTTSAGWRMIVLGHAVGFAFAAVVLCITVVSFPLLLDRHVSPQVAIRTSIRAVVANPVPMALWGCIVGLGLMMGFLLLFVGLAVVLPVLGHATWHLYRKVVV